MNKNKTTIYIVRHGESEANAFDDKIHTVDLSKYGKGQTGLTKKGIKEAKKVAKELRDVFFDAIFSSHLTRAKQTAAFIAKEKNMQIQTIENIHERLFGEQYFKLPLPKRQEMYKALLGLDEEARLNYRYFPDGESAIEAYDRLKTFMDTISPTYKGKIIAVVNHGNIMRTLLVRLGYGSFYELPSGSVINCGYIVLETDGNAYKIVKTHGVSKTPIKQ